MLNTDTKRLDDAIKEHAHCKDNSTTRWRDHMVMHREMKANRRVEIRFLLTFTVLLVSQVILTLYLHYSG